MNMETFSKVHDQLNAYFMLFWMSLPFS